MNSNIKYGDSLITRLYLPWKNTKDEDKIINNIKKSWQGKKVTIVEGKQTRWGVGNHLLDGALSIKRILCPSENAWLVYDKIINACEELKSETDVYILALGPTATVLAYDLALKGAIALDLGHLDLQYEYFVKQSIDRIMIPGKYNNEVVNGNIVDECLDEQYVSSVCRVIE